MCLLECVRLHEIRKIIPMDSIQGNALQTTWTQMGKSPYPANATATASTTKDLEAARRTETTTEHQSTEDESPAATKIEDTQPTATATATATATPTGQDKPRGVFVLKRFAATTYSGLSALWISFSITDQSMPSESLRMNRSPSQQLWNLRKSTPSSIYK